jgi:hypothetical protein
MNKLLKHMSTRLHPALQNVNENKMISTPSNVSIHLKVDSETWRYFDHLDDDARTLLSKVLADYVRQQK